MTDTEGLANRVIAASGDASVFFIDGRSGSGKTTLSRALARAIPGAQLLAVELLTPGWDGLGEGAQSVPQVLDSAGYHPYDWYRHEFTSRVELDRRRPLIVEGCGAISRMNIAAARNWGRAWAVWVECNASLRRDRALRRDGEMYRPHWRRWAEQERHRMRLAQPIAHADQILHTDRTPDAGRLVGC